MPRPQRMQLSRKAGFNLQAESLALNGLPASAEGSTPRIAPRAGLASTIRLSPSSSALPIAE